MHWSRRGVSGATVHRMRGQERSRSSLWQWRSGRPLQEKDHRSPSLFLVLPPAPLAAVAAALIARSADAKDQVIYPNKANTKFFPLIPDGAHCTEIAHGPALASVESNV